MNTRMQTRLSSFGFWIDTCVIFLGFVSVVLWSMEIGDLAAWTNGVFFGTALTRLGIMWVMGISFFSSDWSRVGRFRGQSE